MPLATTKTAPTFIPPGTTAEGLKRGIARNRTALRDLIARERKLRGWVRDGAVRNPGLGRFYGTPKDMLAREVAFLRNRMAWGHRALAVMAARDGVALAKAA